MRWWREKFPTPPVIEPQNPDRPACSPALSYVMRAIIYTVNWKALGRRLSWPVLSAIHVFGWNYKRKPQYWCHNWERNWIPRGTTEARPTGPVCSVLLERHFFEFNTYGDIETPLIPRKVASWTTSWLSGFVEGKCKTYFSKTATYGM
jgi:hypothetical protein